MKKYLYATALVALSSPALAGGLDNPWERPPLIEPPQSSWTGLYVGAGVTVHTRRTTTVTEVPEGYEKSCVSGGSGHSDQKCQITAYDWNNSPEVRGLREVSSPWNKPGLRADGDPGEVVRYMSGYSGIWLNDQPSFTFTSDNPDQPGGSRGATQSVSQVFTDLITIDETEQVTATGFVRYLHDAGAIVFGVEAGHNGMDLYGEGQVGVDMGNLLTYAGYGTEGASVGADVRVTEGLFVGAKYADGRPEARIMVRF